MVGVRRLIRGAMANLELLDAVRGSFAYPEGEKRATGYYDFSPLPWWLEKLPDRLLEWTGEVFTTIAYQAYADGTVGADWHADTPFDAQAILSLGASRRIGLRKGGRSHYLTLDHGDLLFMPSGFQDEWQHCVPLDPAVADERVSLVFRTVRGLA